MQIAEPATNDPATSTAAPKVDIRALSPGEDATPFRTLNEEWITRYFALEPTDIETLGDPETKILRKGGQIFMVYIDSQPIGCVALIPTGPGVYELSKMAVAPAMRGLGLAAVSSSTL